MGGTSGHVALGFAFLTIGLWHLFNSIKLHSLHPSSFRILPWFPLPRFRLLEPFLIISITLVFISMELFNHRTPFSPHGSISFKNLPHFEHSIIALSFFIYAVFAAIFDLFLSPPPLTAPHGLLHFLQAVAFGQQLLILHLHSTDHMGLEGQYHWLLQTITFVSLSTTVLAMGFPGSFLIAFVRGFSVVSQGVWLVVMGFMLWTPHWMPEGCFLKTGPGRRDAIVCQAGDALVRAKGLVGILFGLHLAFLSTVCVALYLVITKLYPQENAQYRCLIKAGEGQERA